MFFFYFAQSVFVCERLRSANKRVASTGALHLRLPRCTIKTACTHTTHSINNHASLSPPHTCTPTSTCASSGRLPRDKPAHRLSKRTYHVHFDTVLWPTRLTRPSKPEDLHFHIQVKSGAHHLLPRRELDRPPHIR